MIEPEENIALVAAIGNPEASYQETRHNAGCWMADRLIERHGQPWQRCSQARGHISRIDVGSGSVRLFKSGVNMNVSGPALASVAHYYRIDSRQLLVLHDELDLAPGVVRIKYAGGSAGHNGIKSIVASLGQGGFWRCRIGIGHPGRPSMVTSYVLSRPPAEERALIDAATECALGHFKDLCGPRRQRAMTAIHSHGAPEAAPAS